MGVLGPLDSTQSYCIATGVLGPADTADDTGLLPTGLQTRR